MAIDSELFKAILAMDSYNRGYNAGIDLGVGSDAVGTAIGNATISATEDGADGHPESFYAVAYSYEGEAIISYRGTDTEPVGMDALTGWGVGLGNSMADQAKLAQEFYDTVSGGDLFGANNISFVGHSMGGGFAGLLSVDSI